MFWYHSFCELSFSFPLLKTCKYSPNFGSSLLAFLAKLLCIRSFDFFDKLQEGPDETSEKIVVANRNNQTTFAEYLILRFNLY